VGGGKVPSEKARSEYLDPVSTTAPVDAELATMARTVVGDRVGRDRIDALVRWVATTIRTDRHQSAAILPVHVFRSKSAGAEGHAELLVALARSLELDARVVSGVLVQRGRVYGHTWAEIEHDGGWVAVDPTFNQIPASSRLIRAAIGIGGRPIELVPLLGSAKFEPILSGIR
jgi:transglutaminase-like putative cysteine protease